MSQQIAKQVANRDKNLLGGSFSRVSRPGYCETGDDLVGLEISLRRFAHQSGRAAANDAQGGITCLAP